MAPNTDQHLFKGQRLWLPKQYCSRAKGEDTKLIASWFDGHFKEHGISVLVSDSKQSQNYIQLACPCNQMCQKQGYGIYKKPRDVTTALDKSFRCTCSFWVLFDPIVQRAYVAVGSADCISHFAHIQQSKATMEPNFTSLEKADQKLIKWFGQMDLPPSIINSIFQSKSGLHLSTSQIRSVKNLCNVCAISTEDKSSPRSAAEKMLFHLRICLECLTHVSLKSLTSGCKRKCAHCMSRMEVPPIQQL